VLASLPKDESWLRGGTFEPVKMIALLRDLCLSSAVEGYKGVRFICDMGWAGEGGVPLHQLLEFEATLNTFVAQQEAALLCLYNRKVFSAELLLDVTKLHPHLNLSGKICRNLLHLPSEQYLCPTHGVSELEIFFSAMRSAADAASEQKQLRQELDQAYAALARKIYENWQEEDTRRTSEQQLHEQDDALKEHKRRLLTILQHLPALLAAFDGEHRLVSCNHEFERSTGFRAEDVVGKRMQELFDAQVSDEMTMAHPFEGGEYRWREWSLRCKDGSLKYISWSNISRYVPIAGWSNWMLGIDVTQKVYAEERLRMLRAELNRQAGELQDFSCAVSHDLCGQLARVSSHCRTMQELCGTTLPTSCHQMLQEIHEATLEMVERMTALLRLTMISTDDFSAQEVDLSAMAAEIAARLRIRDGERAVTFSIEQGLVVRGDEKLLRLAMEQLLENAWNSSRQEEHPEIRFGTTQVEGERSFFVSDNGLRGEIALERPSPSRWTGAEMCGIGLATVERIITLHRGKIWAADEGGKGATFYFKV